MLASAAGKDLSRMALPVHTNEPLSALQKWCEELQYCSLLEVAAKWVAQQRPACACLCLAGGTALWDCAWSLAAACTRCACCRFPGSKQGQHCKHVQCEHALTTSLVLPLPARLKRGSLERLLHVAAFAVSAYASGAFRHCKPFNPMLGETYEYVCPERRFRFLGEKVRGCCRPAGMVL
jgi:hypothetical protein